MYVHYLFVPNTHLNMILTQKELFGMCTAQTIKQKERKSASE